MVIVDKKGEATLSKFLIAIVVLSLFSVSIFTLLATLADKYDNDDYQRATENLSSFNKINSLYDSVNKSKAEFQSLDTDNPLDVVGQVLKGGVTMVKTTFASTEVAVDISAESVRQIKKANPPEDSEGHNIWTAIENSAVVIILILIVITIVLAILTGRRT